MSKKKKTIVDYEKEQIKKNKQDAKDKFEKTESDYKDKSLEYDRIRRLHFYDFFIIIGFYSLFFAISILGQYIKNKKIIGNECSSILTGIGLFVILFCLIINFIRNRQAVNFYNNKTMRYRPMFTTFEAFIKRITKIALLISFLILLTALLIYLI